MVTKVKSSFASVIVNLMEFCSGGQSIRLATTPIPEEDRQGIADSCKAQHPGNPWQQLYCAASRLKYIYYFTGECECCRNYALDMDLIIPLLGWGDAQVTVNKEAIWMESCKYPLNVGHVINVISVTVPSGQYAGQTFRYVLDAGWFRDRLIPYDRYTYDVHAKYNTLWFPYYPRPTSPPSTPPQPLPSQNHWRW